MTMKMATAWEKISIYGKSSELGEREAWLWQVSSLLPNCITHKMQMESSHVYMLCCSSTYGSQLLFFMMSADENLKSLLWSDCHTLSQCLTPFHITHMLLSVTLWMLLLLCKKKFKVTIRKSVVVVVVVGDLLIVTSLTRCRLLLVAGTHLPALLNANLQMPLSGAHEHIFCRAYTMDYGHIATFERKQMYIHGVM